MAAVVKHRFEDRLQYLEYGLLNPAIDDVGNPESPLPASGLGDPDPANIAWLVGSREQRMTQFPKQMWCIFHHFRYTATIHSCRTFIPRDVEQRPGQVRLRRCVFQQPRSIGCPGDRIDCLLDIRLMQQVLLPFGHVRSSNRSAPLRAISKRERQLVRFGT